MSTDISTNANAKPGLLSRLSDADRQRLGDALRRLLEHGSLLGFEPAQSELYNWCRQNQEWVEEVAALMELRIAWEHESRLVQAVPQSPALLMRLKLDATLVLLTLWYEYDSQIRDLGVAEVHLTVLQLNESLMTKFKDLRGIPTESRMREILRLAQRKNLIRWTEETTFDKSRIEVLPTLKKIIPFPSIEEWNRNCQRYLQTQPEESEENSHESQD